MQLPRNLLLLIGISIFGQAALGDGPGLNLHVNNDGRFEALMPTSTKDTVIKAEEITETRYQSEAVVDNVSYRVRVQVISPILISDEFTADMGKNLMDQARKQHREAANNKLKTDRVFKQHGIMTAAFAYSSPAGNGIATRHRVMFDGMRLYLASVTGPESLTQTAGANTFLNSVGPKGANAKNTSAAGTANTTPTEKIPNGLEPFVSEKMGIQALMPADTKEVKGSADFVAFGRTGETGFMISAKPLSDKEQTKVGNLTPEKLIEDLRNAASVLIENGKEELITFRGFQAIESTGTMEGVPHKTKVRAINSGKIIVILATWGEGEYATSNDATIFFDSLRFVKGARGSKVKKGKMPQGTVTEEMANSKRDSTTNNQSLANLLAGKWRVDTIAVQGNRQTPNNGAPDLIEVKDSKIMFFAGGKLIPTMSNVSITCDPKSTVLPGETIRLNFARPSKEGKEGILPCLLKVNEGKLQLAMPMVNSDRDPSTPIDRPVSFDSTAGTFLVLDAKRE